jgi:hypothetical protein
MEIDAGKVRHLLTITIMTTASATSIPVTRDHPAVTIAPSPSSSSAEQKGGSQAVDTIASRALEHSITSQARLSVSITRPPTPSTYRSSFKDNTTSTQKVTKYQDNPNAVDTTTFAMITINAPNLHISTRI